MEAASYAKRRTPSDGRDDRQTKDDGRTMKTIELRRHARRDPNADRLSPSGRADAEDAGRSSSGRYDVVFVSPALRAAETAAWFLRGAGVQLTEHAVVPGLGGQDASGGSPEGMAAGIRALLDQMDVGLVALAVSHTPLVERAAFGLAAIEVEPMAELEGILIEQADDGRIDVSELRRPSPPDARRGTVDRV
jgi:phosphohistidine phosphatase SixA